MGQQCLLLTFGQPGKGLRHGGLLFPRQELLVRRCRRPQVHDPVLVALVAVVVPPHGRDHVPCSDDGVGLKHAGLDPRGRGKHPYERLLDEVVRCRVTADPGANDPAQHRDQRRHVRRSFGLRRDVSGLGSAHSKTVRPGRVIQPARRGLHL